MRSLNFQIRLPSGKVEQIVVESERALLGSGAHCEIRLPLDQANLEHVLIEVGAAGIFATALNFDPPPTINDIPFTKAPLTSEAVLGIKHVQVSVQMLSTGTGERRAAAEAQKKSNPLVLVGLVLIMLCSAYLILSDSNQFGSSIKRPPPPELWGPVVTTCPQAGPQALSFAGQKLALADAKHERRPFYVQDGIQAVTLYEEAAACLRAGGDAASAAGPDNAAKSLRTEINNEYRAHNLRLEHALNIMADRRSDDAVKTEMSKDALKETRALLKFVQGKSGDYVKSLTIRERNLSLKVGSQGNQK